MRSILFLLVCHLAFALPPHEGFQTVECTVRPCARSVPRLPLPLTEGTSTNWSGYAALKRLTNPPKHSVSHVQGVWTVPTLTATPDNSYSAIWVGIDGYLSGTVEQIGTEQDWTSLGQQNYAWFEMYPGPSYELVGFPVNNGDQIGAEVTFQGKSQFQLTIVNYTASVQTTVPSQYTKSKKAKRSSAEWIVEAPSSSNTVLPLANFGTVDFSECTATIEGTTGAINSPSWQNDAITMVASSIVKATPSSLSPGGQAFTVTWEHE